MGIDESNGFSEEDVEPKENASPQPAPAGNGPDKFSRILNRYGLTEGALMEILDGSKRLDKTLEKYGVSESELETIIRSGRGNKPLAVPHLEISDKHFKYGYFSDCHIGHKMFHDELWDKMVRLFKKERVDFILDAGDHLEGMSHRPGHVYELTEIGYNEQMRKAVQLYSALPAKTFGIDGNHDGWYFKPQNMGIIVGEELDRQVAGYTNLGQMEGDLEPAPGIIIKLFHANDGTAYADSYKLQKFIESLSGGEKPNIVHSGHYHKSLYLFRRNVHGFESGTLCGQSEFMRGKKIPAHIGFGVVDVYISSNGGIERLKHEFVPYYEQDKGA